jgi:hypothetical protein
MASNPDLEEWWIFLVIKTCQHSAALFLPSNPDRPAQLDLANDRAPTAGTSVFIREMPGMIRGRMNSKLSLNQKGGSPEPPVLVPIIAEPWYRYCRIVISPRRAHAPAP